MSVARHHNEWLSLVPNSGPFLSLPVLKTAFPQELDRHDPDHARRLRTAFQEWDEDQSSHRPDPAIHRAWVKLVLDETLGFAELLTEKQAIPETLQSKVAEYGETLRPDWVVNDPATKKPRLLVQVYPRSQALGKPVVESRWKTSPDTRMMQLLHDTGIRLGIVTNGDHWMLVNAPKNETTGYASWYANLWLEEPITLRAFRTLLSADRLFSVPDGETLEALLDKSAADQQEVTDQLGYQVRKAVEVLIQALDIADQNHGRKLLGDVNEKVLYESALTVMMRLVILFCAEERELLLLGDELYDRNYAVSTLREQLRTTADQFGEEILALRYDAWVRLLTSFRAVYAGVKHDRLQLPAYGGSLFNPDRFPFLEGRAAGTTWKTTEATPLPVSNRTVLHLLEALQMLQMRLPGGGATEARRLSFRELNIEQIGHVYEGLLDHTAKRATEPMLGLHGTRDNEPEVSVAELERLAAKGEKELLDFLKEQTGRSTVNPIKKALTTEIDDERSTRFRTACQDDALWKRVKPFSGLVRLDTVGYPVVITTRSVFVTAGTDRRSTGTHYTPRSLTEPIVQYTLEPLVYVGPAEGTPKEQWKLKPARELLALKICDMACGSGAFLVQTCRYLAARLLEAWDDVKRADPTLVRITPEGAASTGSPGEKLIPDEPDERFIYALRIVAQRCVYGVDKNSLAVEMAKLSMWLLTLAKNMPFEFLDHAIRCGDSLVGIRNLDQLRKFDLQPDAPGTFDFPGEFEKPVDQALRFRQEITSVQANTVEEVETQERLLREANEKIERLKCVGDMLVGAEFLTWEQRDLIEDELRDEERNEDEASGPGWLKANKVTEAFRRAARAKAANEVTAHFNDSDLGTFQDECSQWLNSQITFHWPLEFPEVMVERGGFDAFVGNPPFRGGTRISIEHGRLYIDWLASQYINGGDRTDYVAYFFQRSWLLLSHLGCVGLLASNSIAETDSRRASLDLICLQNGTLYRVVPDLKWPGGANVTVNVIHFTRSGWFAQCAFGEEFVTVISSLLVPSEHSGVADEPKSLATTLGVCGMGSKPYGEGFLLNSSEATQVLETGSDYSAVIRQYLGGEDVVTSPNATPQRFVINFGERSLAECSQWPLALSIVTDRVKPIRLQDKNTLRRECWWQFERHAKEVYAALAGIKRCLVTPEVAKYLIFSWQSTDIVFASTCNVVATEDDIAFPLLQSTIHELWARRPGLSKLETRHRYNPEQCYRSFPLPSLSPSDLHRQALSHVGTLFFNARSGASRDRLEGLTEIYNRFHDDAEKTSADILNLRELHVEMDRAVAAAYGWNDLNLDHGFHETKQGVRYTISEAARREVLARLLKLNHERYAEEVKQGLHDKKKAKAAPKPKTTTAKATTALFSNDDGGNDDATFPSTERDSYLCGLVCDLVAAEPGLPVAAYVDSLVIALGYKRHKRLLTGGDATKFAKLCKATPLASWSATDKIPWHDLHSLLDQRKAIESEGQTLRAGPQLAEARKSYQDVAPELVALLRKAAAELRDLQAQADPQKAEILKAFAEDKQQWSPVAA